MKGKFHDDGVRRRGQGLTSVVHQFRLSSIGAPFTVQRKITTPGSVGVTVSFECDPLAPCIGSLPHMEFSFIPTLVGAEVTLEPLRSEHAGQLAEAVRDGDLHELWYTRIPAPEHMRQDIETRLAQHAAGQVVPWAVRRNVDETMMGVTTFLNLRPDHRRLEIGSTWIAASAQGTGINTEMKLLQLTHAFETLDCMAVEFRTHWHNHRSRRAIAALGAKQDGVLRNHDVWRDGTVRDVVVSSIIDREWPTVRLALTEKMRTLSRDLRSTTAT